MDDAVDEAVEAVIEEKKMVTKRVESLDELQAAVDVPVLVQIPIRNTIHEVLVRRLRPDEEAQLNLILTEAKPPLKQVADERGNPKTEFDLNDAEYVKKTREAQIVARAMALWWCVDIFRKSKDAPELKSNGEDREKIVKFVQSKLTDRGLEHLYAAARGDVEGLSKGDSLEERIAFI